MGFTKFATFEDAHVLDVKGSASKLHLASLDKLSDYDNYRVGDGYMYVRLRAISSRVNKNHDGWPSVELAGGPDLFQRHSKQSSTGFTIEAADGSKDYGFATFLGKPNFVDHNNHDPKRARGVVVDTKYRVLPMERVAASGDEYWTSAGVDPEHLPPAEIELLIEIDAQQFPKYAHAVRSGELDGFSMGCDVEMSKCSHCGHEATNPTEYCSHIMMKGAHHDLKTADGKRISRRSYENCYGIKFFEISGVFEPADETALAREVRAAVNNEGMVKTAENELPQSMHTTAPDDVDTLREEKICPVCGENMEGETCDVCGYVEPPTGFDNPDLNKAQELKEEMKGKDEAMVDTPEGGSPEDIGNQGQPQGPGLTPPAKQPGSFGQTRGPTASARQTRNPSRTAAVMSEMRWAPVIDQRLAGRINQAEKPLRPTNQPATNEPVRTQVTKSPTGPRTAQQIIGDTMSTKTAQGPTPPGDTSSDARVDVTGVGGVLDASNEAASDAHGSRGQEGAGAQVDVTGIGSTGVTDVDADSTDTLPTAGRETDDSGFNTDKNIESIPTKTYDDSDGTEKGFTEPVTDKAFPQDAEQQEDGYKNSAAHLGYDAAPFYDQPGLSGGSANKGTQPADSVATPGYERVDVLSPATTPEKNTSGPTSTWAPGQDHGHKVEHQEEPVTTEVSKETKDGFTSHIVSALKLADLEVDLDLIHKDKKYDRIAELEGLSDEQITAQYSTLSRVRTAGLAKLAQKRTAGVTKLPPAFGRRTAAPNPDWRPDGRVIERVTDGENSVEPATVGDDVLDSSIFSR